LKDGLEANRKLCLKQQTELRNKLLSADYYQEACQLFFKQHAMLHSVKMAQTEPWSLEDEVFDALSDEKARRIPCNSEHSIIWNIWHIARIEDVAMNLLVAGSRQVLNQDNWLKQMKLKVRDTGSTMDTEGVVDLSNKIDIVALRAYRVAVGRRTRDIVNQLQPEELKHKIDPARLDQVRKEGAVVEAASGLIDYWGKRNIAGLLLMPATRHNLVHLNESLRLKERRN
jgi:hypothetical protein